MGFGQAAPNQSIFGAAQPQQQPQPGGALFGGQQQQQQGGVFGQQQPQQQQGGVFGQQQQQQQQQGGVFGQQQPQQQQGGVFGQQQQQQQQGGLFGQHQPQQKQGGVFGQQQQQQQQGGVFGQQQPQQQQGGVFGQQQQQQQQGGLFGQHQPQQKQGGLFGQQPQHQGALFGGQQQQQQQQQQGSLFGAAPSQPQVQPGGMFGGARPMGGKGGKGGMGLGKARKGLGKGARPMRRFMGRNVLKQAPLKRVALACAAVRVGRFAIEELRSVARAELESVLRDSITVMEHCRKRQLSVDHVLKGTGTPAALTSLPRAFGMRAADLNRTVGRHKSKQKRFFEMPFGGKPFERFAKEIAFNFRSEVRIQKAAMKQIQLLVARKIVAVCERGLAFAQGTPDQQRAKAKKAVAQKKANRNRRQRQQKMNRVPPGKGGARFGVRRPRRAPRSTFGTNVKPPHLARAQFVLQQERDFGRFLSGATFVTPFKRIDTKLRCVMKQVSRTTTRIEKPAVAFMNELLSAYGTAVAQTAAGLTQMTKKATVCSRSIQTAARLVLPQELAKHAMSEGIKAVTKFSCYDGSSGARGRGPCKRVSKSMRAGLQFPDSAARAMLLANTRGRMRVAKAASIYLAATTEYVAAEVFELGCQVLQRGKTKTLRVEHLRTGIVRDEELAQMVRRLGIRL